MSTKRILCIWLPNWPLQRLVVAQPELRQHPVILSIRNPRRGQSVAACCEKSQQHGIYPGMSLSEATSLCRNNLQIYPYDAQEDLGQLQHLASSCECFSPRTGIECVTEHFFRTGSTVTDQQPQSLLMDITGTHPLLGGERQLARQVIFDFHRRGHSIRLAIAATLGAAWALAHFARPQQPPGAGSWFATFPADVTLHSDGVSLAWILSSRHTSDGLGGLPPAALRIPLETIHRLRQAGIQEIATLYQLPRASLLDRLGNRLLKRLDQALGNREEFIDAYHSPTAFVAEQWLEHPTDNQQTIQWITLNLLESLTQSLTQHGQGVLQLECHFRCVDKKHLRTEIRLFQATSEPQHLSALLQMQWNHKFLQSPIQEIKLVAARTAPLESYQRSLFNHQETGNSLTAAGLSHSSSRRLAQLIDRLSRRLGSHRVVQPYLQADAQPERAYHLVSWITHSPQKKSGKSQLASCSTSQPLMTPATRPLQLLSPAPRLSVTAIAFDGSPIRFEYRQHSYHIEHAWGPERIETGWWRGPVIRRDYYRVQTTTGHRFWLFRELHHNHWYLHGHFS